MLSHHAILKKLGNRKRGWGGGGRDFTHKRGPTDILPIFLRFALPLPCFSLSIREAFIRKNPEIVWRFANEGGGGNPLPNYFRFLTVRVYGSIYLWKVKYYSVLKINKTITITITRDRCDI